MNSLKEKLSSLNNQYKDQVWECNQKYDNLKKKRRRN